MATQVQTRRGTTTEHNSFTGANGELTVDTTKKTVVVHDGSTAGGAPLLRQDMSNVPSGTVTSTMIADGTIVNADINASAGIVDTKLATIATAGKVSNSATTATSANTNSTIVARDGSGNFSAGTITAALTGAASANVLKAGDTMTGALSVPLGSATAPSIYPGTDTNTGIYSPGADQLAISTNGTGRLFVDASGRVGLGTSSPSYTLDLTSGNDARARQWVANTSFIGDNGDNTGFQIRPLGSATNGLRISNYANNAEYMRLDSSGRLGLGTSSPDALLTVNGVGAFGAGTAALPSIARSSDLDTGAWFPAANTFAASTAGVERLRIDSTGRVGIGTTSPSQLLHIADASGFATFNTAVISMNRTSGTANYIHTGQSGATLSLSASDAITFGTSTTGTPAPERARIDSSGRLLVGTSTASLTYAGAALTGAQIEGAGNSAQRSLALVHNASANWSPNLFFGRSRGTTKGATTLVGADDTLGGINWGGADGTANFVPAASISAQVDGTPGANDMPGRLVFATTADGASSPTERMRIGNDGDIFFATTSLAPAIGCTMRSIATGTFWINGTSDVANWAQWTFKNGNGTVGSITTSGSATAYNTSSDYRLKENITLLDGAIDRLNQLPVHRFNFIADPDTVVDGFIAHEAAAVVPECVTGTKDEEDEDGNPVYQGIDQSKLVPLLTAALQEAIGRIETLEAEVAVLKGA
jgi:hypothetical protein